MKRWIIFLTSLAMLVTLLAPASSARAAEEEAPKPVVTAQGAVTIEHYYDMEALLKAAAEADEAEDEDGNKLGYKTGSVVGTATVKYPDGTTKKRYYTYSLTVNMEDKPVELDDEGAIASVLEDATAAVSASYDQSEEMFTTSNLWIMLAAFLVFIMHLGFACVESGLTRAKNTVNILFKNTMIPMIGLTTYAICGWLIMYPSDWIVEGVAAFGLGIGGGEKGDPVSNSWLYLDGTSYTVWTDFLFQGMFAATAATIVSGAVAGRVKLLPFLIFSAIFVGLVYPLTGSWQWGGGWLSEMGFADFAGSTLVHAVGGVGALVGAIMLGPRLGKYAKDGTVQPIPGHSMPLVTIGVFLLWFGWFGFNGGSELSANPSGVSWVLVTTSLAACGGGMACGICSWIVGGKPDLTMALNGILAGLVGITAGPDTVNWWQALILVGGISGVIAYFSVITLDKLKIDDPVGAISVHLVCGIYGTLCCGLWGVNGLFSGAGAGQLITQIIGCFSIVITAGLAAFVIFGILKATTGIRVSEHEEIEGLDLGEHDMAAYPDFQQTYIKSYHAREI